jgi:hypothetical protein
MKLSIGSTIRKCVYSLVVVSSLSIYVAELGCEDRGEEAALKFKVEQTPLSEEALLDLANFYWREKRLLECKYAVEKVLEVNSNNKAALKLRERITFLDSLADEKARKEQRKKYIISDLEGSLSVLNEVASVSPDLEPFSDQASQQREQRQHQLDREYGVSMYHEEIPSSESKVVQTAEAWIKAGDNTMARKIYQEQVRAGASSQLFTTFAVFLINLRELTQAEEVAASGISRYPKAPELLVLRQYLPRLRAASGEESLRSMHRELLNDLALIAAIRVDRHLRRQKK